MIQLILGLLLKHWKPIAMGFAIISLVIGLKVAKDRYDKSLIEQGWNAHVQVIEEQRIKAEKIAREKIPQINRRHDEIESEIFKNPDAECGALSDFVIERMPEPRGGRPL